MEQKDRLPYRGYVIDLGAPFTDKRKLVPFTDGVGVLDYVAVATARPEWFDFDETGAPIKIHGNAVTMNAFVDYWKAAGAKVTPVSDSEAAHVRKALTAGEPIDNKYLKVPVDTRKVATKSKPREKPVEAPVVKKPTEDDTAKRAVRAS